MRTKNRMRQIMLLGFLSVFLFGLLAIVDVQGKALPLPGTTYGPETVTITNYEHVAYGANGEMAIGPTGTVSVIYSAPTSHDVMYTDNASGSWSTPIMLYDHKYVNHNNMDIDVDDNGNVHVLTQQSSAGKVGYYTNISGSWTSIDGGSEYPTGLRAAVEPDGSEIHGISWGSDDGPGDSYIPVLTYWNASTSGGAIQGMTATNIGQFVTDYAGDHATGPDIDVNSTGYAHVVFRGMTDICYFAISPMGEIVDLTNLTNVQPGGGWAQWPRIEIDSSDKVHVAFCIDYYGADSRDGLYYMEVNSTSQPDDAVKIDSNVAGGGSRPYMDIDTDGNVHICHTISNQQQITNFNTQVAYASNVGGSWSDMMITNFSTDDSNNFGCADLEINPTTNQAAFLAKYYTHMELHSMQGGKWGHDLKISASISGIQVDYQQNNIEVTLDVNNTGPTARNFDTVMKINNPSTQEPPDQGESEAAEFLNSEGNAQSIEMLAVDEKATYTWNLHYFGGGGYYVEVGMVIDESIDDRMYFSVLWLVNIDADIPGASTALIIFSVGIGTLYLVLKSRKGRKLLVKD